MGDEGVSLVRRAIEAVNSGTFAEVAPEIMAPNFARHDLAQAFPDFVTAAGVTDLMSLLRTSIADFQMEILDVFSAGDRVAMRWVMRGTHRGELLGAAPTGNAVEVNGINIYRIAEQKIAEVWQLADLAGLLRQLDILSITPQ
ncbi:MAG: ester cyclase [Acidimicrobiia bacterium]